MPRAINPAALREIRNDAGITQRQLAARCGVSQQAVSNAERGRHGVSPVLMRKLADTLGVKLDAITIRVPDEVPA